MGTASSIRSKSRSGIADIVRRIWDRDYSLWADPSPGGGGDWMGWLNLPGSNFRFPPLAGEMSEGQRGPEQPDQAHSNTLSNITSLNILGMGGSSLTPEVLSNLFPDSTPALNVFDTVNPATIAEALDSMELSTAAFAVASKSGTTVEPLSLESVFRQALSSAGVKDTSNHFVAISDPGTPLADRAKNGEFAIHAETPANVGGRFSALSAFGMFPASICNMPTDEMTASAIAMADRCRTEDESNPGVELGLFMARNALRGRDKVTFVMSPSLQRFGLWLEQLLAESTGKNGRGLIPIAGEPVLPTESYGDDRQFIRIRLADEETAHSDAFDSHPTYTIELPDRAAIAGEFFRWEFATSVAASGIGVYPFDQPDVESAKQFARAALESESGEADHGQSLNDAMQSTIASGKTGDYVAIAAFLPESDALTNAASGVRSAISETTGMATTFGYGPRYLHSTGQLHKGGPNSVILLALTQDPSIDIDVPGQTYSLGDLLA
ncbi:MAG: hypothetical protein F4Y88_05775, partial [Chloroflexi bacterium]|nr:hypothetical protein [Chloroflexota bacterium]